MTISQHQKNMTINDQKIKYALYCRKSTEDDNRQVLSLDSQEQEMIKMADNLGLEIVQTFRESKSAKKPDNRPQFSELINLIKRGKIDGVICWKIDRLSRNPIDSATIQWLLQQNQLKIIQTMERQYLPGDNALLFNVESGMANQYINVKKHTKVEATPFAFRGLLRCAKCGCLLTATLKKKRHIYYYCTNGKNICDEHKVYLTEDYLSKELLGVFDKLTFDEELIELCYQTKKEQGDGNILYLEESELNLKNRLAKLKERRNTLLDAYLDKTLDKAVYEAKDKQLNNAEVNALKDLSDLKEKLKEAGTDTLERIKNVFLEPKRLKNTFLTLPLDKKREVLFSLLWNAEIGNKKIANISFKQPYKQLSEITNKSDFSSMLGDRDFRLSEFAVAHSLRCRGQR